MPLAFDERQLLTPGIHEATLEEISEHFGRFQRSDRRIKQFDRLRAYLKEVKAAGCGTAVILDGSFVMACVDEPDDIDLLLILPADWDLATELPPYWYNLVSKKRARRDYGLEVIPVMPGSEPEAKWTKFFANVNPKWCDLFGWPMGIFKGVLRVTL
jgi:hypothetical protein